MRATHIAFTHGRWFLAKSPVVVCTWADMRTGLAHTTEPADYRELAV